MKWNNAQLGYVPEGGGVGRGIEEGKGGGVKGERENARYCHSAVDVMMTSPRGSC